MKPSNHAFFNAWRWFLVISGTLLLFTGFAKIITVILGDAGYLHLKDPLLGVQFIYLFLVTGVMEILLAALCFGTTQYFICTALLAWFSVSISIYRLFLWWSNWNLPCPCLGSLDSYLSMSPTTSDALMKTILSIFFAGSFFFGAGAYHLKAAAARNRHRSSGLCEFA